MLSSGILKPGIRCLLIVVIALAVSFLLEQVLVSPVAVLLILQLAAVVIAFQCGSAYACFAAIIEAVAFNFLFTTPRYSLQMFQIDDIANLAVFVIVALITGKFADHYQRQQDELRQVQLRNRILLSVSHDLRTPLATIIGTLSTLKEYRSKLPDNEKEELLDSATAESHRLHQYIENLLQATKLQHGALKIHRHAQSLSHIVSAVAARFDEQSERIVIMQPSPLPAVLVSPSLIEQAIFNVLDNALRYSPNDSKVTVSLKLHPPMVVMDIHNEGEGMNAKQAKEIFELFYSEKGLVHNDSGAGLGLAVSKGIICAHQGKIAAIPAASGCVIRIQLPVNEGDSDFGV